MAEQAVDDRRVSGVDISPPVLRPPLRTTPVPTLEQVERRRFELVATSLLLVMAFAGGIAALASAAEPAGPLATIGTSGGFAGVALLVLAVGFGGSVCYRERRLRRLARALVDERILSAALEARVHEMVSLGDAGKAVLSALELEEVLHVVLGSASRLLGAEEGSIQLVEGEDLVVAAGTGAAASFVGTRRPMADGIAGRVARGREPLLLEGPADAESSGGGRAILSALSVPLEAAGELLGVLNLNVIRSSRRFSPYDLRTLTVFGEQAAAAVRHARALRREQRLREQVTELDDVRARLVGTMTHDLKTPLTTILGAIRTLRGRHRGMDPERREELLAAIERGAERQLDLIQRLLEASRSGAPRPLTPERLDLGVRARQVVEAFASAHARPIEVCVEAGIEVVADADAVEGILANLLENAVKHTPDGTRIGVEVRRGPDGAEIEVSDEGPGIPPEVRERLFEPYQRSGGEGSGAGLGLYIVATLARAMGGEAALRDGDASGAAFLVTLPLTEALSGPVITSVPRGSARGGRGSARPPGDG